MIERPGKRDHAAYTHQSVSGLEADNAAMRCRKPYGASGVRSKSPVAKFGCQCRSRPTRRTTGDMIQLPRVVHGAEVADNRAATKCEFLHVGLADQHSACGL